VSPGRTGFAIVRRPRPETRILKRLTLLAIVFLVAACSPASPDEAVDDFCDAQDELISAVSGLTTLSLASGDGDVDNVRGDIESAWDSYEGETEGLEEELRSQAQNAYTDYLNAVEVIPPDDSIGDRVQAHVDAAQVFLGDLQQISGSVNCE
jgi:hypothetical protein